MMKYILVENQTSVLLGPFFWRQRFIQSELEDLEVDFTIPPVEQGYIKINDTYEIFPVVESNTPSYDSVYETLGGPYFSYENNEASERYDLLNLDIGSVKNNLKQVAAGERYRKEVAGTTLVINGLTVSLQTDRDNRDKFNGLLASIGDASYTWKFNDGFVSLQLVDVQNIVNAIRGYIQSQFDWEKSICDSIDAANSIDELKALVIVEPQQKSPRI